MGKISNIIDELDQKRQIWFCTNQPTQEFMEKEQKNFGYPRLSQYMQRVFDDIKIHGFFLRTYDDESLRVLIEQLQEMRRQIKNGR